MSATELLDQLDQLRAAGTPGPWANPHPFTKLVDAPGSTDNMAIVQCDNATDAALIVAAVNALPQLTAALREVLTLADHWRREGERLGDDGSIHDRHGKALQFAIGDALGPAQP